MHTSTAYFYRRKYIQIVGRSDKYTHIHRVYQEKISLQKEFEWAKFELRIPKTIKIPLQWCSKMTTCHHKIGQLEGLIRYK